MNVPSRITQPPLIRSSPQLNTPVDNRIGHKENLMVPTFNMPLPIAIQASNATSPIEITGPLQIQEAIEITSRTPSVNIAISQDTSLVTTGRYLVSYEETMLLSTIICHLLQFPMSPCQVPLMCLHLRCLTMEPPIMSQVTAPLFIVFLNMVDKMK